MMRGGALYFEGKVRGIMWTVGMVELKNRMMKALKPNHNYSKIKGWIISPAVEHAAQAKQVRGEVRDKLARTYD